MNLLHLKYIIEVDRCGSISKAASALYMNQPHLSKIIKEFEQEMNFKIFERNSKGVTTTKRGRQFLEKAKKIVDEVDSLSNEYQEEELISLDLSTPRASYIAEGFINYLASSKVLNNKVHINYQETNTKETINKVYLGEDEMGIIRFPINDIDYYKNELMHLDLTSEDLLTFDYQILISKNNPLAKKNITIKDLKDQIELVHGDVTLPERPLSKTNELPFLSKSKKVINVYERASQLEILSKLNNAFMLVSPMPSETLQKYDLVSKKCKDLKITCKDQIIYRKGTKLPSDYLDLIKYIKKALKA